MTTATHTILDELTNGLPERNRSLLIESRGIHLITSAINLITSIRETYGEEIAESLEKRIVSSIKSNDITRFTRGVRKLK